MDDSIGKFKKVLETDTTLVIRPLDMDAMCYFSPNSSWCERSGYGRTELSKVNDGGVVLIFIHKGGTKRSVVFARTQYNTWLDDDMNSISLDTVVKYLKDYYLISSSDTYDLLGPNIFFQLRRYLAGKISTSQLVNSDELIDAVRRTDEEGRDDTIVLYFDDEDGYLPYLGLSEEDISFLYNTANGYWEFTNFDNVHEDMAEGYGPFHYFDLENTNLLMKIGHFVLPEKEFSKTDSYFSVLYKKLDSVFERYMSQIQEIYVQILNTESNDSAYEQINREIKQALELRGFEQGRGHTHLKIKVVDLMSLYASLGTTRLEIKDLFEKIFEKANVGGWSDNSYDYEVDIRGFSSELNSKWTEVLENILEKLEDENENITEYFKIYDKITSKYKLQTWYSVPKDDRIMFQIRNIDPEELKIVVRLSDRTGTHKWDKVHAFTYENLDRFLHQPDLFNIFDEN